VFELHRQLMSLARAYVRYLGECHKKHERVACKEKRPGMFRRGEFAFRFFGTPSFPRKGLIENFTKGNTKRKLEIVKMLSLALLGVGEIYPTGRDVELLGGHKLNEAVLRIACRLEGISVRTARRYKSQSVQ
jgi:hypothetical protein